MEKCPACGLENDHVIACPWLVAVGEWSIAKFPGYHFGSDYANKYWRKYWKPKIGEMIKTPGYGTFKIKDFKGNDVQSESGEWYALEKCLPYFGQDLCKFIVGKFYRTQNNIKVKISMATGNGFRYIDPEGMETGVDFNGKVYDDRKHSCDLVEPWPEEKGYISERYDIPRLGEYYQNDVTKRIVQCVVDGHKRPLYIFQKQIVKSKDSLTDADRTKPLWSEAERLQHVIVDNQKKLKEALNLAQIEKRLNYIQLINWLESTSRKEKYGDK